MKKFNFIKTNISDVQIIEPSVFGDDRGFFMETYSQREFAAAGINESFVQENHSRSSRGVLRGMHFQRHHTQGKLLRVTSGSVYDVVVDMRAESPTYGHYEGFILSSANKRQLYIPPRFAHGFLCLEDGTDFLYKCTDYYSPEHDSGILWNDPDVGIDWQLDAFGFNDPSSLLLSEKDLRQPRIKNIDNAALFF